jgi:hypothetical protein
LPGSRGYGTITDYVTLDPIHYCNFGWSSGRFALRVVEIYSVEGDMALAVRRLALMGDDPPDEIANRALLFAENQGYIDSDIALISTLYSDLQTWNPALETPIP